MIISAIEAKEQSNNLANRLMDNLRNTIDEGIRDATIVGNYSCIFFVDTEKVTSNQIDIIVKELIDLGYTAKNTITGLSIHWG